jgi:hypothetical protein
MGRARRSARAAESEAEFVIAKNLTDAARQTRFPSTPKTKKPGVAASNRPGISKSNCQTLRGHAFSSDDTLKESLSAGIPYADN